MTFLKWVWLFIQIQLIVVFIYGPLIVADMYGTVWLWLYVIHIIPIILYLTYWTADGDKEIVL